MDMKKIMAEAQKMKSDLMKVQDTLSKSVYEGNSSLVSVKINGENEVLSVKFNVDDSFDISDIDMLEDMVVVAFNDALKKLNEDKEQKLGKYNSMLSGLM